MRRSGTGSGGGYGMSKNVSPPVRTGQGSRSVRPAGVAQIGQSQGNHLTNKGSTSYRGEPCIMSEISNQRSSGTKLLSMSAEEAPALAASCTANPAVKVVTDQSQAHRVRKAGAFSTTNDRRQQWSRQSFPVNQWNRGSQIG